MASQVKSMIVRVLICLEISLFITSTMADYSEGFGRGSTKRFCGRILTDSLALICNNEYEQFIPSKRSGKQISAENPIIHGALLIFVQSLKNWLSVSSFQNDVDETFEEYAYNDQPAQLMDDLPLNYQSYAYMSKIAPEAALRPRIRREWVARRGVYDECCRKPCSTQELKTYCKRKN